MRINNKNGSHVGFVISFVVFITFVVFMYVILNSRVNFGQEKTNTLKNVEGEITNRISEKLTSASFAVNNLSANCVELNNFLNTTGIGNNFIVINDSGNVLNAGISGQNLQVERNGNTFFRVYSSAEFSQKNNSLGSCQLLNQGSQGYNIGLIKDSNDVFESKIIKLFNNYTLDYENLKKNMNINPGDEFGFRFIYNNGTEIKTPQKNLTINIYIDRISIQYIKTDGVMESGSIDTIVW